mmetsp:Transcript_43233/g.69454  ORF Transcript_43233/g.69454 Transcript_43233/m.69454 type:complete len:269 (-) Transcript_43233:143-949(-)
MTKENHANKVSSLDSHVLRESRSLRSCRPHFLVSSAASVATMACSTHSTPPAVLMRLTWTTLSPAENVPDKKTSKSMHHTERFFCDKMTSIPHAHFCTSTADGCATIAATTLSIPPDSAIFAATLSSAARFRSAQHASCCSSTAIWCAAIAANTCSMPPALAICAWCAPLSLVSMPNAKHAFCCTPTCAGMLPITQDTHLLNIPAAWCATIAVTISSMPPACAIAFWLAVLLARVPSAKHALSCTLASCMYARIPSTISGTLHCASRS